MAKVLLHYKLEDDAEVIIEIVNKLGSDFAVYDLKLVYRKLLEKKIVATKLQFEYCNFMFESIDFQLKDSRKWLYNIELELLNCEIQNDFTLLDTPNKIVIGNSKFKKLYIDIKSFKLDLIIESIEYNLLKISGNKNGNLDIKAKKIESASPVILQELTKVIAKFEECGILDYEFLYTGENVYLSIINATRVVNLRFSENSDVKIKIKNAAIKYFEINNSEKMLNVNSAVIDLDNSPVEKIQWENTKILDFTASNSVIPKDGDWSIVNCICNIFNLNGGIYKGTLNFNSVEFINKIEFCKMMLSEIILLNCLFSNGCTILLDSVRIEKYYEANSMNLHPRIFKRNESNQNNLISIFGLIANFYKSEMNTTKFEPFKYAQNLLMQKNMNNWDKAIITINRFVNGFDQRWERNIAIIAIFNLLCFGLLHFGEALNFNAIYIQSCIYDFSNLILPIFKQEQLLQYSNSQLILIIMAKICNLVLFYLLIRAIRKFVTSKVNNA